MTEHIDSPENIDGRRIVPLSKEEIYKYIKCRCALNQFHKTTIINADNYQDWFWNEDNYLWVRIMIANCVFANMSDVLVNVRSGYEQYASRRGRKTSKAKRNSEDITLSTKTA